MDLKELMRTTPESLAETQFKELKNFAINKLKEVTNLLEEEDFENIKNNHLHFSPAGDSYGTDKYFINFDYKDINEGIDLEEIIYELTYLKNIKDKKMK